MYLDRPPMTTCSTELLAIKSCDKLLLVRKGLFRGIEVLPATVTIDNDGIRSTLSVDRATVVADAKQTLAKDNRTQGK